MWFRVRRLAAPRTVQGKFFIACSLAAVVVVALFVVLVDRVDRARIETVLGRKMERVVANHSIALVDPIRSGDIRRIELVLALALSDPDIVHMAVVDADNDDLARMGRTARGTGDLRMEKPIQLAGHDGLEKIGCLIVEMTAANMNAELARRQISVIGIAVVLLGTLLLVAVMVHRRFVGWPLARLTRAIDRTGAGGAPSRVDWHSDDDVGAMVRAFNRMRDRQDRDAAALAEAHRNLERRVQERTAELEAAKDEAQRADQAKSQFLANMTHELRTPLNAIIGFGQMLEMPTIDHNAETRRDYARDIRTSGEHLLGLINNLLDMARIEAGHAHLENGEVDVRALLDGVIAMMRPMSEAGRVGVELRDRGQGIVLCADAQKLRQIAVNLLSNAVKFTPEGGNVVVSVERTHDGGLQLTVADTGIGIDPADVDRVLHPFEQVEHPMARKFQGTGLGLPLVKQLVELHGGTFDLISALGQGTKAVAAFPPERVRTLAQDARLRA